MARRKTLAVVEDNDDLRILMKKYFGDEYRVILFRDYEEATASAVDWLDVDIAILDFDLGSWEHNGLHLAGWIRKRTGRPHLILYTVSDEYEIQHDPDYEGLHHYIDQFLYKPIKMSHLRAEIARNIEEEE